MRAVIIIIVLTDGLNLKFFERFQELLLAYQAWDMFFFVSSYVNQKDKYLIFYFAIVVDLILSVMTLWTVA
jgi:hypothetical protein